MSYPSLGDNTKGASAYCQIEAPWFCQRDLEWVGISVLVLGIVFYRSGAELGQFQSIGHS